MLHRWRSRLTTCVLSGVTALSLSPLNASGQQIAQAIDEGQRVTLKGNVHPLARQEFDRGAVLASTSFERLVLLLKRSPEQEAALEKLMADQLNPQSPNFHHWLTPKEFGEKYGPSDEDIATVTNWLSEHGFEVTNVSQGRVTIEFSGTAAQIQSAFQTEIHQYAVSGETHIANVSNPSIPSALEPVVAGIASLNDFFPKPQHVVGSRVVRQVKTGRIQRLSNSQSTPIPDYHFTDSSGNSEEDITPYDFATIYNLLPLWNAGINGSGQTIAISGASDINPNDVKTFQSTFGLPNNPPTFIHNGADPGIVSGAEGENTLDVEWSGATAPKAKIVLVVSGSTKTSFGGLLSNEYIIDHDTAPVMSASYGQCELDLGTTGNQTYSSLYQQGAAEGITIFVSAGDQGSSGCESQDVAAPNAASTGLEVNGMASTPYNVSVGGTDFYWQPDESTYWNSANASNGSSAKGYIPEYPWNSTCTSTILVAAFGVSDQETLCNEALGSETYYPLVVIGAGSGGVSHCTTPTGTADTDCSGGYSKPSWQSGTGVPADGKRDVPDLALFASGGYPSGIRGSAYLICDSNAQACNYTNPDEIIYQEIGGTSASSPAMAGIMSLVVQKAGGAQGLANPVFYKLAAKESLSSCASGSVKSGNSCSFYDITAGSIASVCVSGSLNCVTNTSGDQVGVLSGYSAGTGFDRATGLGSVNAANLVNNWASAAGTPAVTLSASSLTFPSTKVGSSASQTVTVKNSGGAPLTLSSIAISGTNASSYSETNTCKTAPGILAVGASCSIAVTFKPTATGTLTATVSVTDNATGSPQKISLTGSGNNGSTGALTLSPTSISFADETVGSESEAQTVTLKNTGTSTVTLHSLSLTGTNPSSFEQLSTCGSTLGAGASCAVFVAFKPATAASLKATLSVSDTAPGSPQTVTLTGTGTAAPSVTLSTTSLTFAATSPGTTSEAQSVTVKNAGASTIQITGITITGTNASSFLQANECGATLAAGSSCTVLVAFDPTTAGSLKASLNISDTGSKSPQQVSLSGTGK